MRRFLLILLLLSLSCYAYSQQVARYGGAGFFRTGYANLHRASRALGQFTPATFAPLGNDFACIGGEGYARLNKYIVGGAGYGMFRRGASRDDIHAHPFSAGGTLHAGRIILDRPRLWCYPLAGVGFSVIGLSQYESDPSGQRLNESTVILPNINIHFGIAADWLAVPITSDDGERSGGLLLGFRAGYQLSPVTSNWKGDESLSVREGPHYATNGYFLTLTIGAGGFVRR